MNIPILMYHSIDIVENPRYRSFAVAPSLFAEHIAYLHDQGYTTLTVDQLTRAETLPRRPVVLTFDDAFTDFYSAALPTLAHYGFTATLYVPTAFVGKTSLWLVRERETTRPLLDWQSLIDVTHAGIECGAHTCNHVQLDILPLQTAHSEVEQSRKTLEDKLGKPVTTFAYPYGYFTAAVRQMVIDCGYRAACAVKNRLSSTIDDRFALSRLTVTADTSVENLAGLLNHHNSRLQDLFWLAKSAAWRAFRHSAAQLGRRF